MITTTTQNDYPTGSEWGKWDLHIHSNASDGDGTPSEIIKKAKEKGLSVIALTDHHTAKNIDEIKEEGKKEGITVISGIEFRTEYGSRSVHMIGLFPENHGNAKLNSKALHDLILSPLDLSETKIIAKGKEEDSTIENDKAFKKGMFLVQVPFKEASDLIHKYGGLVVVHAGTKVNSFENEMKHQGKSDKNTSELYDSLGTVKEQLLRENYIDICEIRKENDSENFYLEKFNKVSIIASDAHKINDIGSKSVWIKANPTFEGLKQVANESSRIFIGDIPPLLKRIQEYPHRYIQKLNFEKLSTPSLNESWFENIELELNPGLVAIIGNKGNGKSAFADTIGLLGDTQNHKDFSFLINTKFRKPKPNRSESFKATLHWRSSLHSVTKLLNDTPHLQAIEKVKYLPQGYLETLCNENHSNFLEELRNVIFTYIPDNERFGKINLAELETFTTNSIQKEIEQIIKEIKEINKKIAELEIKDTDTYKQQIESNLKKKKEDLENHQLAKPIEVISPSESTDLDKTVSENIETTKRNIEEKTSKIKEIELNLGSVLLSKKNLESVLSTLNIFEDNFKKVKVEITPKLEENSINVDEVLTLQIEKKSIDEKFLEISKQIEGYRKSLNSVETDSLPNQLSGLNDTLNKLQTQLDQPSRLYQKYVSDIQNWTSSESEIIGNVSQFGTLKYYENEIKYIETQLETDFIFLRDSRNEVLKQLFDKKLGVLNFHKSFYKPITEFFSQNDDILKEYEIKLDAENILTGFEEMFLSQIDAGKKGSFYGTAEGGRKITDIIFNSKFETQDDIISFLDTIIDHLRFDKRQNWNNDKREVSNQLKNGYTVEKLYDFLFSLDYLEPTYKLKLNDKNIEGLSPGERGALLLIFYLALDKNDIPLIIDQPEENLDNQSVYNLLAQFIKKAKEKRQVIIVTHNPNLAVVCDADQIVHVKIEKHNDNKVIVKSGALENPEIIKTVVDILEGTFNAFDTRKMKYRVIQR